MTSRLRTANLVGALAVAIADRIEAALKTHPNQNDSAAAAINMIAMSEGCSIAVLSAALKLSHPAAVRLVAKLVDVGLVEARSGSDKRTSALFLTADGRAKGKAILETRCLILEEIVEPLTAEQRALFSGLAETILRALTTSPVEGGYICRLCDETACPEDICPVHRRALDLMTA